MSQETLNKSFLPFFTTLSVTYFRALLKTAKRMLRIIQLFPKAAIKRPKQNISQSKINIFPKVFNRRTHRC